MSIRAVIFDTYHTLLQVEPPPRDAAARWELLWEDFFADPARLTLEEFAIETQKVITREHVAARTRGIPFPEVDWLSVSRETLPELARIADSKAADFLFAHRQLVHTVSVNKNVAVTLRALNNAGIPLGIASNAQAYTLRELETCLAAHQLDREVFAADLCFWSFERGFSKPDPEVFRWLDTRLQTRGIAAAGTLMVGDRIDNDIEPATRAGWQTWRMTDENIIGENHAGDWSQLHQFLRHEVAPG
jgi:putative hydrolase of the HAD superfamily